MLFSIIFLELLQHNMSLVTLIAVFLEDSIFIWGNKYNLIAERILSDKQTVHSLSGLFYFTHSSQRRKKESFPLNTTTTFGVCLTCCVRGAARLSTLGAFDD